MSTLGTLALAYGLIWAIIGSYVWFLSRRQAALSRQLDGLEAEMDEVAAKPSQEH